MPGVILLSSTLPIAQAIDELADDSLATEAEEWVNQIAYLPLR